MMGPSPGTEPRSMLIADDIQRAIWLCVKVKVPLIEIFCVLLLMVARTH